MNSVWKHTKWLKIPFFKVNNSQLPKAQSTKHLIIFLNSLYSTHFVSNAYSIMQHFVDVGPRVIERFLS